MNNTKNIEVGDVIRNLAGNYCRVARIDHGAQSNVLVFWGKWVDRVGDVDNTEGCPHSLLYTIHPMLIRKRINDNKEAIEILSNVERDLA